MNDRIDELAWQAGCNKVSHHDPDYPDGNGWIINQETMDKFAELIVKECAELMEKQYPWITSVSASKLIREHFGVEE